MTVPRGSLSFAEVSPHLGQVKMFSSIFVFIRVSQLGQNFIEKSSHYFFKEGLIAPDSSFIVSEALALASWMTSNGSLFFVTTLRKYSFVRGCLRITPAKSTLFSFKSSC